MKMHNKPLQKSQIRKVQCWIYCKHDQKIYCLLLKTIPQRGSFWQPVTGTVEENEGYFEAACREPLEETGFQFKSAPVDSTFEFEYVSRQGPAKERIFALEVESLHPPILDSKEHQDFQWIEAHQAQGLLRFQSNIDGLKKTYRLLFNEDLQ